jgi:hypothetical protein
MKVSTKPEQDHIADGRASAVERPLSSEKARHQLGKLSECDGSQRSQNYVQSDDTFSAINNCRTDLARFQ